MAKPIYVPEDEASRIIAELKTQILGSKCYGSIDIRKTFKGDDRCAVLYFTSLAWIKMTALVSEFTTEVQWHGLVKRLSEFEFEVYDILVPPHSVTAATVTSDQEKYTEWINNLDDDSFNSLRFHGHSHVNMAVTPSVVDKDYRKNVVTQLPKPDERNDEFYIFLIINKSHDWSAEIYDLTNNALYSTTSKEIDIMVMLDDGDTVDNFVLEAKRVAVQTTPSYSSYNNQYGKGAHNERGGSYGYLYNGSYGNNVGTHVAPKQVAATSVNDNMHGKKNTKSTSVRGDDDYYGVDERPTDPFYAREGWYN